MEDAIEEAICFWKLELMILTIIITIIAGLGGFIIGFVLGQLS